MRNSRLIRGCTEAADQREPFSSWNFTAPAPFDINKSHPFEKKMPSKEKLADLSPKSLACTTNPVEESQEMEKKALSVTEAENTFSPPNSSLKSTCEEATIPEASPKNVSVEEEPSYRASFSRVVTKLVHHLENSLTSGTGRPIAPHHSTRNATDEFFDSDRNVGAEETTLACGRSGKKKRKKKKKENCLNAARPDASLPPRPISRSGSSVQGTEAPAAGSGNQDSVIRIHCGQRVIEIHF